MRRLVALTATLAVLATGCLAGLTPLQQHKVSANQATTWLEDMAEYLLDRHAAADEAEREYLEAEVNPIFNRLKRATRGYVLGLEIWERTGTRPAGLDEQRQLVQELTVLVFELIATAGGGD